LLLPAALLGLPPITAEVPLVAASYLALPVAAVVLPWPGGGLGRRAGLIIIAGYLACVAFVVAS